VKFDIKDKGLREVGVKRIEWAHMAMPVLESIRKRFEKDRPLEGLTLGACLHVTTETANLAITLNAGGARVFLCASNPLSTQDDVAAALVTEFEIPVFAIKGENDKTYYDHINAIIDEKPNVTMDDGADLVSVLHSKRTDDLKNVMGGTEETTTGVIRLASMAENGVLNYPIVAVNDANTKHFFDNRYGTGQSTIDGVVRATNRLIAGSVFVVCGYGWCGKGLAMRASGMGANVVVTEVEPLMALEAVMDGFRVMPIAEAAEIGDFFVTVTGDVNVISVEAFKRMKDGAVVANSGHFNVELDLEGLEKITTKKREIREFTIEHTMKNGKRVYVLGEGRLINLAAAEGHPAAVMDMSFANQALCTEYIFNNHETLENKVYPVPIDIDREIARLKLAAMGVRIDTLTPEQQEYLSSWHIGT